MFLVFLAAALGVALGVSLLDGPAQLRSDLRALPALGLGTVFLLSAEWLPIPGKPGVFIVGTALLVVGLLQNRHLPGVGILAFGLFLTGFVVLINGYLPLRAEAAASTDTTASGLRQDESETTTLGILGDVIPLGPWILSFGDLIATGGGFILGRNLVRSRESARASRRAGAPSRAGAPNRARAADTTASTGGKRNAAMPVLTDDPIVVVEPHPTPEPVAISADEFLAKYLELDNAPAESSNLDGDQHDSRHGKNPVIDLRGMPAPPTPNPDNRFIRVQSGDDQQS